MRERNRGERRKGKEEGWDKGREMRNGVRERKGKRKDSFVKGTMRRSQKEKRKRWRIEERKKYKYSFDFKWKVPSFSPIFLKFCFYFKFLFSDASQLRRLSHKIVVVSVDVDCCDVISKVM